jgi:hypothetical protein
MGLPFDPVEVHRLPVPELAPQEAVSGRPRGRSPHR